jgi:hypothetical protein
METSSINGALDNVTDKTQWRQKSLRAVPQGGLCNILNDKSKQLEIQVLEGNTINNSPSKERFCCIAPVAVLMFAPLGTILTS